LRKFSEEIEAELDECQQGLDAKQSEIDGLKSRVKEAEDEAARLRQQYQEEVVGHVQEL
jgi:uncharacterized coiled-coil DUF342 family protein